MRGSKGASDPLAASVESAPVTSAELEAALRPRTGQPVHWRSRTACHSGSARPSFGPSVSGAKPASSSASPAGRRPPPIANLSNPDHGGRHMRQRCEIARRPNRALTRNDRHQIARQHRLEQAPSVAGPHARRALGEAGEFQRHHQARHRPSASARRRRRRGRGRYCAAGFRGPLPRIRTLASFPEAGVDAVDRLAPRHDANTAASASLPTSRSASWVERTMAAPR